MKCRCNCKTSLLLRGHPQHKEASMKNIFANIMLVIDTVMLGTYTLFGEEAVLGASITPQRRILFVALVAVANIIAVFSQSKCEARGN